jgi:hypothetical protein
MWVKYVVIGMFIVFPFFFYMVATGKFNKARPSAPEKE